MTERISKDKPVPAYAAFIKRHGWYNWQEAVTVLKHTKTGWRVRYETGLHTGKICNVTRRNWEVTIRG